MAEVLLELEHPTANWNRLDGFCSIHGKSECASVVCAGAESVNLLPWRRRHERKLLRERLYPEDRSWCGLFVRRQSGRAPAFESGKTTRKVRQCGSAGRWRNRRLPRHAPSPCNAAPLGV